MNKVYIILLLILGLSCEKSEFDTSPDIQLHFSTDSLVFDTIFSGIGSTTKYLKVYNPSEKDIKISRIFVGKGDASKYRLNIDGRPAGSENDVVLKGKDSLYIFVEVTINTNEDALLEQDSILFETNGNQQDIKLLAWGQDVYLINGEIINSTEWTSEKPYLVYNSMLIDTNQVLTIEKGTKIYFHRNSRMYVAGTLIVNGTFEDPVYFDSDRTEQVYSDVPGQWDGIWLMNGSKHNFLNWAEIKNAVIGIQVDTLADIDVPTLSIHNSKIEHMSFAGIYAQGTTIFATNCLIDDCGYYTLALTIGGEYNFYHCTFANYWQNSFRNTPSLLLNNYYKYNNLYIIRDIEHAGFYNCIVYGDRQNEIFVDAYSGSGKLEYNFDNCLLKYTIDAGLSESRLSGCLANEEPLFKSKFAYDFRLDTLSPAINKASKAFVDQFPALLQYDLLNKSRISDVNPDAGAFEWYGNLK
ncbi:MAG: hypothetical protein U0W24_05460 [Bacteroidales bacterium]